MDADHPWVRGELPWLRSGPLFRVHRSARPALDAFLDRFRYRCLCLDGRAMTSRPGAHAELARAFGFPDYYGANWDAFHDCVDDRPGELTAVVWDHLDVAARAAPATTAEVGWALLDGDRWDVFAIGDGDDFDRP